MSQPGNNSPTTWFVTGASRGFGRELTEQLLARGDRVAATLRRPGQLDDLTALWWSPTLATACSVLRRT